MNDDLQLTTADDTFHQRTDDPWWTGLYLPIARSANWISALVVTLQGGRIAVYLMYSFITLLILLLVARP